MAFYKQDGFFYGIVVVHTRLLYAKMDGSAVWLWISMAAVSWGNGSEKLKSCQPFSGRPPQHRERLPRTGSRTMVFVVPKNWPVVTA